MRSTHHTASVYVCNVCLLACMRLCMHVYLCNFQEINGHLWHRQIKEV